MNTAMSFSRPFHSAAEPSTGLRVFTACGDTMYRRGVQAVLAEDRAFVWAGEAATSEEARRLAPGLAPDVVVIDAQLPGAGGLDTLQALRMQMPRTRFAILLSQLEPDLVRSAVSFGAGCVLAKSASQDEIVTALKAVHRGVWAHSEAVAQALTAPRTAPDFRGRLTPRERDLLTLMAQGLSNGEISSRLAIAMPTVKFHVGHIMAKLGTENRTAAVLVALRHRLVELHSPEAHALPSLPTTGPTMAPLTAAPVLAANSPVHEPSPTAASTARL